MSVTSDYLVNLKAQQSALATNLTACGIEASNDELFNTLAPKIAELKPTCVIGEWTPAEDTPTFSLDNLPFKTGFLDISDYSMLDIPGILEFSYYNSGISGVRKGHIGYHTGTRRMYAMMSATSTLVNTTDNSIFFTFPPENDGRFFKGGHTYHWIAYKENPSGGI